MEKIIPLVVVAELSLLLGGCGGPSTQEAARTEQLESQGLSAEEKRTIASAVYLRALPNKIHALKIWPSEKSAFLNATSLDGSKFDLVEVEYRYMRTPHGVLDVVATFSAAPTEERVCMVLQFVNGKIDRQVPAGLGNCSREGAEDMMPVVRQIESGMTPKPVEPTKQPKTVASKFK